MRGVWSGKRDGIWNDDWGWNERAMMTMDDIDGLLIAFLYVEGMV